MKEEKFKDWPTYNLDLTLLAGAMEAGKALYLTGLFGGFGGVLYSVHPTYDEAKRHILKVQSSAGGAMIFKLDLPEPLKFISNTGEELNP